MKKMKQKNILFGVTQQTSKIKVEYLYKKNTTHHELLNNLEAIIKACAWEFGGLLMVTDFTFLLLV